MVVKVRQCVDHLPVKHQRSGRIAGCLVDDLLRRDHAASFVRPHVMLCQRLSLHFYLCTVKTERAAWICLQIIHLLLQLFCVGPVIIALAHGNVSAPGPWEIKSAADIGQSFGILVFRL